MSWMARSRSGPQEGERSHIFCYNCPEQLGFIGGGYFENGIEDSPMTAANDALVNAGYNRFLI